MSVTGAGAVFQAPATVTAVGDEQPSNGGFLWPNTPNIVDFWGFLNTSFQIPTSDLPTTSPWPQYALTQALTLVLNPPCGVGILYTLAVYNAATHLLFMITPDQTGQKYFEDARSPNTGYNLIQPSTGLIISTSDVTDSSTIAQPKWAAGLTITQLGFFKTPWGREYLGYQQSYGPTVWGLS
jgi:hypothetical protein